MSFSVLPSLFSWVLGLSYVSVLCALLVAAFWRLGPYAYVRSCALLLCLRLFDLSLTYANREPGVFLWGLNLWFFIPLALGGIWFSAIVLLDFFQENDRARRWYAAWILLVFALLVFAFYLIVLDNEMEDFLFFHRYPHGTGEIY